MTSKFKIGDLVAANHSLGTIVEITATQIVIEVNDKRSDSGKRAVKITLEQAQKLGMTLDQAFEAYVSKVALVTE